MKFTECDFDKVKYRAFQKRTKIYGVLLDFVNAHIKCAKIEDWHYKDAMTGARVINVSIKHFKFAGIRAISRDGEIYLVNELVQEQGE